LSIPFWLYSLVCLHAVQSNFCLLRSTFIILGLSPIQRLPPGNPSRFNAASRPCNCPKGNLQLIAYRPRHNVPSAFVAKIVPPNQLRLQARVTQGAVGLMQ